MVNPVRKHRSVKQKPALRPQRGVALRKAVLTVAGLALIYGLFQLPVYNWWWNDRLMRYYREFPGQWQMEQPEKILFARHGYAYLIPRQIDQNLPRDAVVLLPSRQYVRKNFSTKMFQWYHGAWNYYFFGPERKYYHYDPRLNLPLEKITHVVLPITPETGIEKSLLEGSMLLLPPIPNNRGEAVEIRAIPVRSAAQLQEIIEMIEKNSE